MVKYNIVLRGYYLNAGASLNIHHLMNLVPCTIDSVKGIKNDVLPTPVKAMK